ncbi:MULTISPECIES: hypothetical protein [Streptosporangium]|uniref:Uncharacterized protein n=1 Tax=Streptosporangium brasiliense TaxID=47480 RepID=A0ABT9RJA5_9ACTN|nr:hypothetical protein [Streptosporangium brasiliense]MDP9868385.1 hypothetical protein [Streptosporangium brasiliense]
MLDSLIVPLLVTTDLPPDADLAEFGSLLADTVRTLGDGEASYSGFLHGGVFWLDRPGPPAHDGGSAVSMAEELRFAALIGYLSISGVRHSPKEVVAGVREVITEAVAGRYGDLGSPPAVMAIRTEDVRERTPPSALPVRTADAVAELVAVARPYM